MPPETAPSSEPGPVTVTAALCRCTWPGAVPLPETCPSCDLPMTAALTADPQWRDARVVGHMRMFNDEMRWIVERSDGTQHRIVAVVVQEDWQTPIPHGVGVNDA